MKKSSKELANKWLVNRFNKILTNDNMDEWTADAMSDLIDEWKNSYTERALERLDEQIAKFQEMRQLTLKKLEQEKASAE